MSQIDLKIGPKIKAFRRQLGLQANKLAEDLSISPSYLNLIEGGKRKIDGDLLLKILFPFTDQTLSFVGIFILFPMLVQPVSI